MKRLVYAAPVLAFLILAFFLFKSLISPTPDVLPSPLIDKPVPQRTLPALDARTEGFGPKELASGKVVVVNVFSSTCVPCREEAPVLNRLAARPDITLYGFVWEDKPENARQFLDDVGNPFSRIGLDIDGAIGREWGIYGWPETYVVDGHGIIRFKYVGALSDRLVAERLLPAIEKARLAG
ncbi:MAG TPA: DsbE family thiol:disulfide interchange protein [Rhizomicrobium sp.]|nr:DsbE family thiol:disulfide interchange protein [Rhizomicrobium sp.]